MDGYQVARQIKLHGMARCWPDSKDLFSVCLTCSASSLLVAHRGLPALVLCLVQTGVLGRG